MASIVEVIAEATQNEELAYRVYEAIRPRRLTEIEDEIYNDEESEIIWKQWLDWVMTERI